MRKCAHRAPRDAKAISSVKLIMRLHAHARRQVNLEQRDRGTGNPADNLRHDAEIFEGVLQLSGKRAKLSLVGFGSNFGMANETKRRQGEIAARLPSLLNAELSIFLACGRTCSTRFRTPQTRRRHRSNDVSYGFWAAPSFESGCKALWTASASSSRRKRLTLRFQHPRFRRRLREGCSLPAVLSRKARALRREVE